MSAVLQRTGVLKELDGYDLCEAVLRCGDVIGSVHMDLLSRTYHRRCSIVGTEGSALWEDDRGTLTLYKVGQKPQVRSHGFDRNDQFRAEAAHFVRCLMGKEEPLVTVEDAARTLAVCDAMRTSSLSRRCTSVDGLGGS